jgi:farnesyl-diphosphate farnesyltransferase
MAEPLSLLRSVSRSFYLSIRLLPAGLRAPVGLAYLLARTSDTVADTGTVDTARRQDLLAALGQSFETGRVKEEVRRGLGVFAQAQSNPDERRLLEHADACVAALQQLQEADRADVQAVLRHILRGQQFDLDWFRSRDEVRALPDAAALETYTYLVAGCVGEFWTDICARHIGDYATLPHAEMRELGRSFGCGLQLVNIVRDARDDLSQGRCYFPADELAEEGLRPGDIATAADGFLPVWRHWQDEAWDRMADGMSYAEAVQPRRVRAAVALPAILGVRTLALMRQAGAGALAERVKVPRREVRAILLRMALTLAGREALRAEWDNRAR